MPTYSPIASTTLGSANGTITFSNISQSYNDLVIWASLRATGTTNNVDIRLNGLTNTSTYGLLRGENTTASAESNSASTGGIIGLTNSGFSSNAFTSFDMYFVNYSSSNEIIFGLGFGSENSWNSTSLYENRIQGSYTVSGPITSITLDISTDTFVAGSSVYLYGITRA